MERNDIKDEFGNSATVKFTLGQREDGWDFHVFSMQVEVTYWCWTGGGANKIETRSVGTIPAGSLEPLLNAVKNVSKNVRLDNGVHYLSMTMMVDDGRIEVSDWSEAPGCVAITFTKNPNDQIVLNEEQWPLFESMIEQIHAL